MSDKAVFCCTGTVFVRTHGCPQTLSFAELSVSTPAPYQTVEKFISALIMMPNLLWGVLMLAGVCGGLYACGNARVHPAADMLKTTSKSH